MMDSDTASQETIRRLETELGVYKRAYADLDADRRRVERLKLETEKQKEDLENQLKVANVSNLHLLIKWWRYPGSSNHCTLGRRWRYL